jgi:precorrin isomerase
VNPSPEDRLTALENQMKFLISHISYQGGELQAVTAALQGFLTIAGDIQEIQAKIDWHLERSASSNLAESTNQQQVDGFDNAANLIRLAMKVKSEKTPKAD